MSNSTTRRGFLEKLCAGFAFLAAGCTGPRIWPIRRPGRGSVRIVFYTDVHARTEWETPLAMERAARAINDRHADLVLAGGDLITEGFESSAKRVAPRWDAYMAMHRSIQGDLYPAIGNHDLVAANPKDGTPASEDPRAIFRSRMGLDRTYYSFNAAGYHFVTLDSIQITDDDDQYQGLVWPEQLAWLKQDLSRLPKNTPVVLVTHIPMLTSFFGATQGGTFQAKKNRVIVNNLDVLNLVERHNVVLVLQGHLHVNEIIKWRNTTFIGGGAVCGKWWRGSWFGTGEGFQEIILSENGIHHQYVGYGWKARRP